MLRTAAACSATWVVLTISATSLAQSGAMSEVETCASASESAQSLRNDLKLVAARGKLLICTRPACPRPIKRDCDEMLSQLDASLPTIVLGAKDKEGRDLTDIRVLLDGAPLSTALDGRAMAVDPGRHLLRFERSGSTPVERTIVAHESEKDRVVIVVMAASPQGEAPTAPTSPARHSEPRVPTMAYVLGTAGVVALGATSCTWPLRDSPTSNNAGARDAASVTSARSSSSARLRGPALGIGAGN